MHENRLPLIYRKLLEAFGPQHWWPGETPFEVAVGAILTQNTNWSNVEKAVSNLKAAGALNPPALRRMRRDRLALLIKPAGYFNIKTKRLKAFVDFLCKGFRGSMSRMAREDAGELRKRLLEVHGIGPETADSILLYALKKPVFVVDAYTKRILSRHRIVDSRASYETLQDLFHRMLPPDEAVYNEFHALIVRLGKEYCRPRPLCSGCPLDFLKR